MAADMLATPRPHGRRLARPGKRRGRRGAARRALVEEARGLEAPAFPDEEYAERLARVHERMDQEGHDALLLTSPENIFYLTGLDHQGFFVYHGLIVPRRGEPVLITRAMERATVEAQVGHARFIGYADNGDPVAVTCTALEEAGLATARIGIEKASLCFPPEIYEGILRALPQAEWRDASLLVFDLRLVKSPRELAYTREAARVSDAMMQAGIAAARVGANEKEVAAEVHRAMILNGGGNPGYAPFIRTTERLRQEHTTWRDRELRPGDALFLEMSACVNRYHAPLGRLVFVDHAPEGTEEACRVCVEAFDAAAEALRPGATAAEVCRAWQARVDAAGLTWRRHHCGYAIGLGFPPSWSGGSRVVGLREDSDLVIQSGMAFHLMSWLIGAGRGDHFLSNTVILTDDHCELLTRADSALQIV